MIKVVKFRSLSEVIFDFALGFYGQIESLGIVGHCVQLLSQLSLFVILILNQRCNVSNSKGIEIYPHNHPNESPNVLKVVSESKVSVANSCDSLECPVEGLSVLVKGVRVYNSSASYPGVILVVYNSGDEVPDTSHEVDQVDLK